MAGEYDPYKLIRPTVYLIRMLLFIGVSAFLPFILYQQVYTSFMSNPLLNGLILVVLAIGVFLSFRQVTILFGEVKWVNGFRNEDTDITLARPPVLLAPMATILGDRAGRMAISTQAMRSLLESIGMRLDESREISRYLTGLLVFLGLLGTFWGLLLTVGSVGETIQSLEVTSGNANVIFEDLKAGLEAPLSGMATAFSSSLFGLAGSLVLGFLDLQAGQAQNRFYNDLEDWLSTVTDLDTEQIFDRDAEEGTSAEDLRNAIERLSRTIQEGGGRGPKADISGQNATAAMSTLAEGIQGLVQHIRSEQQLVRNWMEAQGEQQAEIRRLLQSLDAALSDTEGKDG